MIKLAIGFAHMFSVYVLPSEELVEIAERTFINQIFVDSFSMTIRTLEQQGSFIELFDRKLRAIYPFAYPLDCSVSYDRKLLLTMNEDNEWSIFLEDGKDLYLTNVSHHYFDEVVNNMLPSCLKVGLSLEGEASWLRQDESLFHVRDSYNGAVDCLRVVVNDGVSLTSYKVSRLAYSFAGNRRKDSFGSVRLVLTLDNGEAVSLVFSRGGCVDAEFLECRCGSVHSCFVSIFLLLP